ncbi:MAG: branched-chain amino acid ABC transporter permease [Roseovarius sp.]|nr:branched-chain amino acid ABC transporter permease [Roseovarius sp.]
MEGSSTSLLSALVLIFGLRRVVNFAHGGLFHGRCICRLHGRHVFELLAGHRRFCPRTGRARRVARPVRVPPLQNENHIVTVLVTFGILLVLEDVVQTIWGKDFLSMATPPLLSGTVTIFDDIFPVYRLAVILVAAGVAVGLTLWLRYSRIGLFVRASSVDAETTAIQGVDTDKMSMIVVAVGTGLAGLSGTVAGPLLALSPAMGSFILIESFIVVVVGGLGSFSGAFLAAIIIGQIHNFAILYLPWAATMIPLILMVGVLIWRPTGVAGSHV